MSSVLDHAAYRRLAVFIASLGLLTACSDRSITSSSHPADLRRQSKNEPNSFAGAYTTWSTPENLGAPVNDASANSRSPGVSPDGRSLFFSSDRAGTLGDLDLWVSARLNRNKAWQAPVHLPAGVNSAFHDANPSFSPDGRTMFFNSNRPGGCGGQDLWVSTRSADERRDDLAWGEPANLGCAINGRGVDQGAALFVDRETGVWTLYYSTDKPGALGQRDIFSTTMTSDGTWSAPSPVSELNSIYDEARPTIRRDGLEIFFWSGTRPGGSGSFNVWTSTRASVNDAWSSPTPAFANMSLAGLSANGTEIYLSAFRNGAAGFTDLFVSRRQRISDADERE